MPLIQKCSVATNSILSVPCGATAPPAAWRIRGRLAVRSAAARCDPADAPRAEAISPDHRRACPRVPVSCPPSSSLLVALRIPPRRNYPVLAPPGGRTSHSRRACRREACRARRARPACALRPPPLPPTWSPGRWERALVLDGERSHDQGPLTKRSAAAAAVAQGDGACGGRLEWCKRRRGEAASERAAVARWSGRGDARPASCGSRFRQMLCPSWNAVPRSIERLGGRKCGWLCCATACRTGCNT
eukprot:57245-Chlamydomonas_euryale.AAC.5